MRQAVRHLHGVIGRRRADAEFLPHMVGEELLEARVAGPDVGVVAGDNQEAPQHREQSLLLQLRAQQAAADHARGLVPVLQADVAGDGNFNLRPRLCQFLKQRGFVGCHFLLGERRQFYRHVGMLLIVSVV